MRSISLDADERIRAIALVGLGGLPGAFLGGLVGLFLASGSAWLLPAIVVGALVGGSLVGFTAAAITSGVGVSAGRLFSPGSGRPARPGLSRAESLVVRGELEKALEVLEEAAHASPKDPAPLLRGARVLRDELDRHPEAVRWLLRARERIAPGTPEAAFVERELEDTWSKARRGGG